MKPFITAPVRAMLVLTALCALVCCSDEDLRPAAAPDGDKESKLGSFDTISPEAFMNPPLEARPGAYWCWLNGHVDHERITRTNLKGQHTKSSPLVPSGLLGPVTLQPLKQE